MASEADWNPGLWFSAGGTVPSDWDLVPFGDLLQSPKSIAVGVMYPGSQIDGGVPLIRVGDVGSGGVVRQPSMAISPDVHYEYRRTALSGNELLITLVGTPGVCVLARPEMAGWNVARALAVAKLKQPDLRPFIKAVLESSVMRNIILGMLNTTVQPTLNLKEIKVLPVPIPHDLTVALELGRVAELFSERIASLQQTNTTLEAIAQALFKSWFVDFDPVRAKAEGREPEGMGAATAAQFPAKMEASEIGLIPEGWQAKPLDSIAKYTNGLALQKYPPESETEFLPVVKIAQLRAGHTVGADRASMNLKPDYVVEDGDVLFSWSGSLLVEQWCGGRGALNQHLFKVTSGEVPRWFYFLATRHHLPHFREVAANKATTMGHIQRRHLAEAFIALPSSTVLEEASKLFTPLLETWLHNAQKARLLQELRDTLLPRLISGKLRLPDAEREVEAAIA